MIEKITESLELLLQARPLTDSEAVYWRGWLGTLVTLGEVSGLADDRFREAAAVVRAVIRTPHPGEPPPVNPGCRYHRILVLGCSACDAKARRRAPDRRVVADTARSANWLFVETRADGTETVIDSGVAWVAGNAPPDYPPWREGER